MIDLPPGDLDELRRVLTDQGIDDAIAFGSRTRGAAHRGSDLDVAVPRLMERLALRDAIEWSDMRTRVDLSDLDALPPSIREEIARTGVPLRPV